MASTNVDVTNSGVIAMPMGLVIPVTAIPSVGLVFKFVIGHALPLEPSATQAVLPSGVIAMALRIDPYP